MSDDRVAMPSGPEVMNEFILPPCARPGAEGDWWKEQHDYCTGSHHIGPDEIVRCTCACHSDWAKGLPDAWVKLLADPTVELPGDRAAFLEAMTYWRDKVRVLTNALRSIATSSDEVVADDLRTFAKEALDD